MKVSAPIDLRTYRYGHILLGGLVAHPHNSAVLALVHFELGRIADKGLDSLVLLRIRLGAGAHVGERQRTNGWHRKYLAQVRIEHRVNCGADLSRTVGFRISQRIQLRFHRFQRGINVDAPVFVTNKLDGCHDVFSLGDLVSVCTRMRVRRKMGSPMPPGY